jgi:putative transcriptional regulator
MLNLRFDRTIFRAYGLRMEADAIRATRVATGLTQAAFAERYCIPLATVRDWEQARFKPDKTSATYLRLIAARPVEIAAMVAKLAR